MTTEVYMRSSKLSYIELANDMAAFIGEADIDVDEFCNHVIEKVNRNMPGSMVWYPNLSEIWINVDDESEVELDEIQEWIGDCAILTEAEFYSEVA